ncbi:MAG: SDR family oxidoreductase [Promethearchaeia archaeon]
MVNQKLIDKQPFKDKIVIVVGGSKGIGKATAILLSQLGGNICVIARTEETLKKATQEIKENLYSENQFVEYISCDATDMDKLKPLLEDFIIKHRVPDYLINAVGYAYPNYVQNLKLKDFKRNMDINYYGQLVPILILLPYFMKAKTGYIVNVSSMMGYFGIMGYATYAPTKFAIVGLTEVLRHELKPYNIKFSLLYPPDTDTPGFHEENQTKPPECRIMSEQTDLLCPEEVAEELVEGILNERFEILPGKAKSTWRMFRHFPKLVRKIIDRDYKKAMDQINRKIE